MSVQWISLKQNHFVPVQFDSIKQVIQLCDICIGPSSIRKIDIHTDRDNHKLLNLYMNTLTLGAVWQYLLPGTDTHAPLSTFFRLIEQVASDFPSGEVLKKHKGGY